MAETPASPLPITLSASAAAIVTAGGAATWTVVRSLLVCNITEQLIRVVVGKHTSAADAVGRRIASYREVYPHETVDVIPPAGFVVLQGDATTPQLLYAFADIASGAVLTPSYTTGP